MTDRDDLDPADWLASQFGEEPPPAKTVTPPVAPPIPPLAAPPAFTPPAIFAPPPAAAPPAAAPPAPAQAPPAPFSFAAEAPQPSPVQPFPVPPAVVAPAPADQLGGGFSWSLTPGAAATPPPTPEFAAPVESPSPPVWNPPPAAVAPPAEVTPPVWRTDVEAPTQAFSFDAPIGGPNEPVNSYDMPTQAIAFPGAADLPTQVLPGQALSPVWQPEPSAGSWFAAPLDPALDGVTEVLQAELVGPDVPDGEGREATALDDLFGDNRFQDFSDEPFIAPLPLRQPADSGDEIGPKPARAPIPRNQKILMWIAGGLVAALALVALFTLGTKLSGAVAPPAALPTPTPTETTPSVAAIGPVAPGEHRWDELLGGECIAPYQSAWQDSYVVVNCTTPHPAQMVLRGKFDDPASATYPGIDALQKRVPALCGSPTVINYAVAGTASDIQITASFAADETDWAAGNRTFYCFATRAAGATFASSIAIPQKPAAPTPAPTPSK